jgi:hypothetical protein
VVDVRNNSVGWRPCDLVSAPLLALIVRLHRLRSTTSYCFFSATNRAFVDLSLSSDINPVSLFTFNLQSFALGSSHLSDISLSLTLNYPIDSEVYTLVLFLRTDQWRWESESLAFVHVYQLKVRFVLFLSIITLVILSHEPLMLDLIVNISLRPDSSKRERIKICHKATTVLVDKYPWRIFGRDA